MPGSLPADAHEQVGDDGPAALRFRGVHLRRDGHPVLSGVDWEVGAGERWVVLGPNGSGKTTLIQLACGYLHPTLGTVEVLGQRLGRVDVRRLRRRIGLVSGAVTRMLVSSLTASEVVVSGRHGVLEPWWHRYSDDDRAEARRLLAVAGCTHVADRAFGVLSEGERQQVLLARAMMARPELVLLDEPCAGLDVAGRERLMTRLAQVAAEPGSPPTVLVTHHVEEIPPAFTHLLLLRDGAVVAAGPLPVALTSAALSRCFGMPLLLGGSAGRWTCRAAPPVTGRRERCPGGK
jgi:iron complex transport system ATP-binding protein